MARKWNQVFHDNDRDLDPTISEIRRRVLAANSPTERSELETALRYFSERLLGNTNSRDSLRELLSHEVECSDVKDLPDTPELRKLREERDRLQAKRIETVSTSQETEELDRRLAKARERNSELTGRRDDLQRRASELD